VHYNDVDDVGRTSWRTRPQGTLAPTPISELALIIGVAADGAAAAAAAQWSGVDGSDGPTQRRVAARRRTEEA